MMNRYFTGALGALALLPLAASAQDRVAGQGPTYYPEVDVRGGTEVLRHYDPAAGQTINTATGGGWVYGTNAYGDKAKVTCFDAPAQPIRIESVTGYLFVGDGAFGTPYDVVIYPGAPGLDGEPGAGPQGAALYRQTFDSGNITATAATDPIPPLEHALTAPQTLATSFCVGFEWAEGTPADEIGMVSQDLGDAPDPSPYDWELWAGTDGWKNLNEAWTDFRALLWIDANYTPVTASEEGPAAAARLLVAPNPFRGGASLTFTVERAQRVTVEVTNVLGQRVALVQDGVVAAGDHAVALSGAGLAAGAYAVRVVGEDFTATRRVVVLN
jgi:hypothetical protein